LFFSIISLSSCERDLQEKEPKIETHESQFQKLNGFFNAEAKIISTDELPDAFKKQLFDIMDIQLTNKKSQKNIVENNFETNVSVIKGEDGIITYALPIKDNANIVSKLKNGALSKMLAKGECDNIIYQVLALNVDSKTGKYGDLYLVSFGASYGGQSGGGGIGVGTGSSFNPISISTTITNTSTGISSTVSTPTSNSPSSNPNRIFSGIWNTISNIANSIGNFFKNIFRAKKCHCPNYSGKNNSILNKDNFNIVTECDCFGMDKKNQKTTINSLEFDFSIPLPDSFLNGTTLKNNPEYCDCMFRKINLNIASEAVKKDYFDCACNSSSVGGIAILLKLSLEQSEWLGRSENIKTKSEICKFIRDNNYDNSSKKFANEIITQMILNPNLNLDIAASYKSPMNIDFGTISNNTPEGAKFNEVYTALTQSPEFKKLFESIFKDSKRFNVKFEIAEHVYLNNNSTNKEVNAITIQDPKEKFIKIIINKQILIPNGTMNQTKIENAKTILHECIHAYLFIKAGNPATGVDFVKLLNSMYPTANEQHDFMYNNMVPTMQKVLGEIRDFVTTEPRRIDVSDLKIYTKNDKSAFEIWNWSNFYKYLSTKGLEEANCYKDDYPDSSDALFLRGQYITYGHARLDKN
jgi:hypothetical protein